MIQWNKNSLVSGGGAEIIEDAVDSTIDSMVYPSEIAQGLGELWNVPRVVGKFVEWRLRNVPFWTRRPLFHSACFRATKFTGMAYLEFAAIEINVSYNTRASPLSNVTILSIIRLVSLILGEGLILAPFESSRWNFGSFKFIRDSCISF